MTKESDTAFQILFTNGTGKVIDSLDENDVARTDSNGVWSDRILGATFGVSVVSATKPTSLRVCVDRYSFESPEAYIGGKAVVNEGNDRRMVLKKDNPYYKYSPPTALLLVQMAHSGQETNCTGFPLSETIFVTNYHCISEKWQIRTALAKFDYEIKSNGQKPFDMRFSKLLVADKDLDFALLRMKTAVSKKYVAQFSTTDVSPSENLVLIQHPSAMRKMIVSEGCVVQFASAAGLTSSMTDFYHLCDSSGGSSGSAVLDAATGRVVGLHHLGRFDPHSANYHNLALKISLLMKSLKDSREQDAKGAYDEIVTANNQ